MNLSNNMLIQFISEILLITGETLQKVLIPNVVLSFYNEDAYKSISYAFGSWYLINSLAFVNRNLSL